MNSDYQPCAYRFILIEGHLIKLFASWSGGYLDGDSWRLNSGTTKIEETGDGYLVHGYSGSVYSICKYSGSLNAYSASILAKMVAQDGVEEVGVERAIEVLNRYD